MEASPQDETATLEAKRPEGRILRRLIVMVWMGLLPLGFAVAQVSVQIGLPGVNIGINQPVYPQLVQVPGYPVYYDPGANSNYFFYDGMYWVYAGDSWYASSWYNGPWALVAPQAVPAFILRVPVRYYQHPPAYFQGWGQNAPPRWGEHWGNDWERQRSGWDRWNRNAAPRPAPLPVYQQQYSGNRYPQVEQQHALRNQNYQYRPRDGEVKQVYQGQPGYRQSQQAPGRPGPQQQASPQPAQREYRGEQQERNRQQEQGQPAYRQPQQAAPGRPGPQQQASPQPAQRENRGEEQGRSKQEEHAQPANRETHQEQPRGNPQARGDEHGPDRRN